MLEALGPGTRLGYCTNVHAGRDLAQTLAYLERHAAGVRRHLALPELGAGLWLSAAAAREARSRPDVLKPWLHDLGLRVFTLNGFPHSDFHQPVVKHRVYQPDWSDRRRLEYTIDLIDILHSLLPPGEEGSISTLPLGWPGPPCPEVDPAAAAAQLRIVAQSLARLEQETGRLIHLDLEPEPGCLLQRSAGVVRFWEDHLLRGHAADEPSVRRYLRVCHDVCHAAVMFEPQEDAFRNYNSAGILVGKVQISSALRLADVTPAQRPGALAELARFQEPRYLHQTCVRAGALHAFADLPDALAAMGDGGEGAEWRVHFHVPIHLQSIGLLGTTQDQIAPALALARTHAVRHFEVETYAWTVLPPSLQPAELAAGIADELRWVTATCGVSATGTDA